MRSKIIYLDNNATTSCIPEVQEAIRVCMTEQWGNASSQHYIGRQARKLLEEARQKVSCVLKCRPSEVFFNSGATEGNNWIFWSILFNRLRKCISTDSIGSHFVIWRFYDNLHQFEYCTDGRRGYFRIFAWGNRLILYR